MCDSAATPAPGEHEREAFDHWLDESDHHVLILSISDDCWQGIAYEAALAAYKAGFAAVRKLAVDHDATYVDTRGPRHELRWFSDLLEPPAAAGLRGQVAADSDGAS
jgi:hypothetical protein